MTIIQALNRSAASGPGSRFLDPCRRVLWLQDFRVWMIDPIEHCPGPAERDGEPVALSLGDADAVRELASDSEFQFRVSDVQFYLRFVGMGGRLFLARGKDQIVAHALAVTGSKGSWTKRFLLKDDEFVFAHCFTKAAYRGQGLYPLLIQYACRVLAADGFVRAYLEIATHNEASERGAMKARAVPSGSGYLHLRLWNRNMVLPYGPLKDRFA